jgi:predicted enzyme related to lactoylglutathione lyase
MPKDFNPVGWFEIPVQDMNRAIAFYAEVLGIGLSVHEMGETEMGWFPMKAGEPGSPGALIRAEGYEPSMQGVVVYLTCPDIDGALERAAANGGEILLPRTSIGEHGFVGFMKDSEGNRIGLHSRE